MTAEVDDDEAEAERCYDTIRVRIDRRKLGGCKIKVSCGL